MAKILKKKEEEALMEIYILHKNIPWKSEHIIGMVVQAWNPSTGEVDVGLSGVQGQLKYMGPWLNKTNNKTKKFEIEKAPIFLKYHKTQSTLHFS